MKMRKVIIIVCVICIFIVSGCDTSTEYTNKINDLNSRVIILEEYMNSKEDNIESKENENTEVLQDDEFKFLTVKVVDMVSLPIDTSIGRYSSRVEFMFEIENTSDTDIRGISGELFVYDLFEKSIIDFKLDFTQDIIPAKSTIVVDGLGFDVNRFIDNHVKIYNSLFDTLIFNYKINNIIY